MQVQNSSYTLGNPKVLPQWLPPWQLSGFSETMHNFMRRLQSEQNDNCSYETMPTQWWHLKWSISQGLTGWSCQEYGTCYRQGSIRSLRTKVQHKAEERTQGSAGLGSWTSTVVHHMQYFHHVSRPLLCLGCSPVQDCRESCQCLYCARWAQMPHPKV